jgi:hypothetical protein
LFGGADIKTDSLTVRNGGQFGIKQFSWCGMRVGLMQVLSIVQMCRYVHPAGSSLLVVVVGKTKMTFFLMMKCLLGISPASEY